MRSDEIRVGNIVRVTHIASTEGMLCGPEHMDARKDGATGRIIGLETTASEENHVLVWVRHGTTKTVAPYWNYELLLVGELVR